MTANHLAVLVLWYGVGYAVLLHSNIWAGLGGLLIVALLAQGSHGDGGGMLVAYALGLVVRWVIRSGRLSWLRWQGWGWFGGYFPHFNAWRHRQTPEDRDPTAAADSRTTGTAEESAEYRRRAEEARQRRQQEEDTHKHRRGKSRRGREQDAHEEPNQQKQGQGQEEQQDKTSPEAPTDTRTPEEILGVRLGCTYEELKHAYRLQCQRLHPDRWQDRPPHIRTMLEEEQKKVNGAFQRLKKRFY